MQKYRLVRRNGTFYCVDRGTRERFSLKTKDRQDAIRLIGAKNEASQQPELNLHIARAYLAAADPKMLIRTWDHALQEIIRLKNGPTKERWIRAAKVIGPWRGFPTNGTQQKSERLPVS